MLEGTEDREPRGTNLDTETPSVTTIMDKVHFHLVATHPLLLIHSFPQGQEPRGQMYFTDKFFHIADSPEGGGCD